MVEEGEGSDNERMVDRILPLVGKNNEVNPEEGGKGSGIGNLQAQHLESYTVAEEEVR